MSGWNSNNFRKKSSQKTSKYSNRRVYECESCGIYHLPGPKPCECGHVHQKKPAVCSCGSQAITTFDSWKEFTRWKELKLHQKAGLIKNLKRQVRMPVVINGVKVFAYVADFDYYTDQDQHVVEDSKGFVTEVFRLKKKSVEAFYGIKIKVT